MLWLCVSEMIRSRLGITLGDSGRESSLWLDNEVRDSKGFPMGPGSGP